MSDGWQGKDEIPDAYFEQAGVGEKVIAERVLTPWSGSQSDFTLTQMFVLPLGGGRAGYVLYPVGPSGIAIKDRIVMCKKGQEPYYLLGAFAGDRIYADYWLTMGVPEVQDEIISLRVSRRTYQCKQVGVNLHASIDALTYMPTSQEIQRIYKKLSSPQGTEQTRRRPPEGYEDCPDCSNGGYNGLPGGACPSCRNQGIVPITAAEGSIQMDTNEMVTILQLEAGAKIVQATYLDDAMGDANAYSFKNVLGLELRKGDMIVAETRGSFSLLEVKDPDVMVTEVGCPLSSLKHVVAKVRNDAYENIKKQEAEAHRKLALSEVTSKLTTYREQVGEGTFGTVAGLLGIAQDDDEVIEPPAAPESATN